MTAPTLSRRVFLGSTAIAALGAAQIRTAAAETPGDGFQYEITRSEAEWRARLSEADYNILRKGGTEEKFSSPYWNAHDDGQYACKGCDLTLYSSVWQVYPDVGWAFFRHAEPNAILMGIDGNPYVGMTDIRVLSIIEAHCRRCGSHLGHILTVGKTTLHCINGAALNFTTGPV
ncbi:peptide-methionine (R)-S-oxide reductase [Fluviibacterium sp. DFM31]|uniref:peptide-methionine (R)-S-oxide reductase n=1 Tax=Meridianimarinicoccus marinus TaxID=3231483 RepID=A0ABV3L684_9RHOB